MKRIGIALVVVWYGFSVEPGAWAEDKLRSGLQPGERITSIFEPLNVTGPFAGERHCLVCENGANPVAMIFAREVTDALVQLLVKLDAATADRKSLEMGSFLVLLSDQADQPQKLQQLARRHGLRQIVLSVDEPRGPDGFSVAPEADLTVVLYRNFEIKANHAFRKGELTGKSVDAIMADVPKILVSK
jgi:hypothetical protein